MRRQVLGLAVMAWAVFGLAGVAAAQAPGGAGMAGGRQGGVPPIDVEWNDALPAGTADHAARALKESPRHGEWVDIKLSDGSLLNSWVVYPERPTKSGVVLVIHDINGMRDIPRAVGDQLAQDGFIAIVPDFLSGKGPNGGGSASLGTGVGQAIRTLTPDEVNARLNAAMEYGKKLPASNGKVGVVGFCWGGARSFGYAAAQPGLNAAVVFYGEAPGTADGHCRGAARQPQGARAWPLRRQRRAHQRNHSRDPGRDDEARQELRSEQLRRRRPRLHGQPGWRRRREPQSVTGGVADGGGVLQKALELVTRGLGLKA